MVHAISQMQSTTNLIYITNCHNRKCIFPQLVLQYVSIHPLETKMTSDQLDLAIDRIHYLLERSTKLKNLNKEREAAICTTEAEHHASYLREYLYDDLLISCLHIT